MLLNIFKSQKTKTHDFRDLERGVDYFVDFAESGKSAILTTTSTVKVGDEIVLPYRKKTVKYCTEAIDRYWNDESIKTVLLKRYA